MARAQKVRPVQKKQTPVATARERIILGVPELLRRYEEGERDFRGILLPIGADLKDKVLAEVDFTGAILREVLFSGTDLHLANFTNSRLFKTDFTGANAHEAVFTEADAKYSFFTDTQLPDAVFKGTKLTRAILSNAVFKGSDLTDAIFSGASVGGTNFAFTDLRGIKNFEKAEDIGYALFYRTIVTPEQREVIIEARRTAEVDKIFITLSGIARQ